MKATRILPLLFVTLILVECLACAVPTFAAVDYDASSTGGFKLGVTMRNFGMQATVKGAAGAIHSFEAGDLSDGSEFYGAEKYTPFEGDSGYYYLLDIYNEECDYEVTIREFYIMPNKSEKLTNIWTCTTSTDIHIQDGYKYTVDFKKRDSYVEGQYYVSSREVYFWLPEVFDATDVLKDLSRDTTFNARDYPQASDSYDMEVIQISEDADKNLFICVYDPSCLQTAAKINMSLQHYEADELSYQLYDLICVSSSGTLRKYVVKNFTVSDDECRFYNIAAVYTRFNSNIHSIEDTSEDDITNYKGYPVGKCFAAYSYNNELCYDCMKVDVVDVDILGTGAIRYQNGFNLSGIEYTDSHFVVFDVKNYDVDHIYDATITYTTTPYSYQYAIGAGSSERFGDPVEHVKEIYDSDTGKTFDGTFNITGLVSGKLYTGVSYEWKRILTVGEFNNQIESYNGKVEYAAESQYGNSAWVFQFLETPYTTWGTVGVGNGYNSTRVSDVALLRLRFATPVGCYNLGCVSDIVSDDGKPDIVVTPDVPLAWGDDGFGDLEIILTAVFLILLLIIFAYIFPVVKQIFKAIFNGFSAVISILISIVVFPFKAIYSLFSNKKDR